MLVGLITIPTSLTRFILIIENSTDNSGIVLSPPVWRLHFHRSIFLLSKTMSVLHIYFIFNETKPVHSCTLLITMHFQTTWFKQRIILEIVPSEIMQAYTVTSRHSALLRISKLAYWIIIWIMIPSEIWYLIVFNQVTERKKIDRISGQWTDRLLAGSRAIILSQFPFCDEDVTRPPAGLRLEITTRDLNDNCVSIACSIYHFAHLLRAVSKNSGYVYTDCFMESARVNF